MAAMRTRMRFHGHRDGRGLRSAARRGDASEPLLRRAGRGRDPAWWYRGWDGRTRIGECLYQRLPTPSAVPSLRRGSYRPRRPVPRIAGQRLAVALAHPRASIPSAVSPGAGAEPGRRRPSHADGIYRLLFAPASGIPSLVRGVLERSVRRPAALLAVANPLRILEPAGAGGGQRDGRRRRSALAHVVPARWPADVAPAGQRAHWWWLTRY